MDDLGLLQEYVENRSEAAFGKLVERHLHMVYSVACRMVGNAHQAEEVAQNVFTTLAQKAHTLGKKQIVAGWLWHTTRHLALHTVRAEQRRHARELAAVTMQDLALPDPSAEHILANLESAMSELDDADREALVLRHLENRNLRDVGRELGISEDAARMRVNRALEKLRAVFTGKGITVSGALLFTTLAATSAKAVPLGLPLIITSTALSAAKANLGASAVASTTKWMSLKTAALVTATLVLGSAAFLVEQHQPGATNHASATIAAPPTENPAQPVMVGLPNSPLASTRPDLWVSASVSAPAPEVQSLLKRAITLLAAKQCIEARALLDEAIERKPDFAEAYFYRGNAFAGLGQLVAATDNYSRAIELQPTMFLAWHERGSLHEKLQEFSLAVLDCDQVIKLNDGFWQAWLIRGRSKYRQHLDTEARLDFERVLELQPDCAEARQFLAKIPLAIPGGLATRDLQAALTDLDRTLAAAPGRPDIYTKRGLILLALKRPKDAVEAFDKSLELLSESNLNAWFGRAQAWVALDQPQKAIEDYSRIIAVDAGWRNVVTERGLLEFNLGQFEEASRDFERAVQSGDQSENTRLLAALNAIQFGKDDSALQLFSQAERINPSGPDRFELRGLAYANLSRWSEAVADYTQAIRRHSQLGRLYYYRSVAEARLEQIDTALADALKALAAKDLDVQQRLQLTLLAQGWLRERGRSQEARRWLRQPNLNTASGWEGSLVRFLRGDVTWDQVLRTASTDTERSEGFVYAGWVDVLDGHVEAGRVKLQWVMDHGDNKLLEYDLAHRLLVAL